MDSLDMLKILEGEFSDDTFGADVPFTGPLNHMKKEIDECLEDGDFEEFADLLLLLLDAYRKKYPGQSTSVLIYAAHNKLIKNWGRDWGEPDENGVVEHKREEDQRSGFV